MPEKTTVLISWIDLSHRLQVWKVVRKVDAATYALKEVALTGLSRKEQEDCVHEVHVLSKLDCPYIVQYFDCFVENQKLYIVTEYAPGVCSHRPIAHACERRSPCASSFDHKSLHTLSLIHISEPTRPY